MDLFSSAEEVREMRDRMAELVAGFDGASTSVFSTKDHVRLDGDGFESYLPSSDFLLHITNLIGA
jgi:phytanoyl-CoA hydroxylase